MRVAFGREDLEELDRGLLSRATRVIPMIDAHRGAGVPGTIALRHDVDDNPRSLEIALEFGQWELERGYRSTYFLLHGSHYWDEAAGAARALVGMGHEIGIHVNAIAESLRTGIPPETILHEALHDLRSAGIGVVGAAYHGDPLCRYADQTIRFVNDEIFLECVRPDLPLRPRTVEALGRETTIIPLSLSVFGLDYEASWIPRDDYLSESGARWSQPFEDVVRRFEDPLRLHMLIHPDWWGAALLEEV